MDTAPERWRPLWTGYTCGCLFWNDGACPADNNPQLHWCKQHWDADRANGLRELRDRGLLDWPKVTQFPPVQSPIVLP